MDPEPVRGIVTAKMVEEVYVIYFSKTLFPCKVSKPLSVIHQILLVILYMQLLCHGDR